MSAISLPKTVTFQLDRYFIVSAVILLFCSSVVSAGTPGGLDPSGQRTAPEGGLRQTEWTDMLPHTMNGDYYNEFWNYHLFFEDELHLHLTFSLANFGSMKSPVSGGKLFVSNFKGKNYNVAREFSLEHIVVDNERQKIRLHQGRDIYLQGALPYEHHLYFSTAKDGIRYHVDLNFRDIHQGYTWGDGVFHLEEEKMGIFVHIPRAAVSGMVAINEDTLHVNGTAYMDHTFQTDLSSKMVSKGFRHISHADGGFHSGYYLVPKNRSHASVMGFSLQSKNSPTLLEKAASLSVLDSDRIGGRTVPRHVEVVFESGNRTVFSRQQDFQHVSFLEEIGGIRRRLVRSFLGGEVIEYVGTGKKEGNVPMKYNFFLVH